MQFLNRSTYFDKYCSPLTNKPCFYTNFSNENTRNIKFLITKNSYKVFSLIQEPAIALLRHLAIMALLLESHCFSYLRFFSSDLTMMMYSSNYDKLVIITTTEETKHRKITIWLQGKIADYRGHAKFIRTEH